MLIYIYELLLQWQKVDEDKDGGTLSFVEALWKGLLCLNEGLGYVYFVFGEMFPDLHFRKRRFENCLFVSEVWVVVLCEIILH